jgi:hypothetical protein
MRNGFTQVRHTTCNKKANACIHLPGMHVVPLEPGGNTGADCLVVNSSDTTQQRQLCKPHTVCILQCNLQYWAYQLRQCQGVTSDRSWTS